MRNHIATAAIAAIVVGAAMWTPTTPAAPAAAITTHTNPTHAYMLTIRTLIPALTDTRDTDIIVAAHMLCHGHKRGDSTTALIADVTAAGLNRPDAATMVNAAIATWCPR